MIRLFKIFDGWLGKIESCAILVLLTGMILISFSQVFMRNFFSSGLSWAEILLRHWALWLGLLGASIAAQQSRHLSIAFLSHLLSARKNRILRILVHFGSGIVCAFLTKSAWDFVMFEKEGGSLLIFDIPTWAFQTVIPYAFAVISFRFILHAIELSFTPTDEKR
ncbi:MAG: TRAP transporter small permease [Candidatus Nitrohelix vancouverensis]|uniref:TRAP transporter small permease n=1 Tax=Candidatus Nitrohelix vancouverensis TaxID=2705534 RepID=A0A7T0C3H5_9BACT|nr:MAG: TRAP transporter small permease [Candidatus Nitrohelix vancouverensis]